MESDQCGDERVEAFLVIDLSRQRADEAEISMEEVSLGIVLSKNRVVFPRSEKSSSKDSKSPIELDGQHRLNVRHESTSS